MSELLTAVQYDMNITHILLTNNELGKISKGQKAGDWHVWQTSLHNPNFGDHANICGAKGIRATKKEDLENGFAQALEHPGPSLVEILSDPELI
jgi:thiamine pyrophosphate-dependent acetolactate synthase large subunit-like protein